MKIKDKPDSSLSETKNKGIDAVPQVTNNANYRENQAKLQVVTQIQSQKVSEKAKNAVWESDSDDVIYQGSI